MWLRDELVELARLDTHDHVVFAHTTTHLATDHERQAAEHLLLFDVRARHKRGADSLRKRHL